jgi:hypothetical protein
MEKTLEFKKYIKEISMGLHDRYGKKLMCQIKGFRESGDSVVVRLNGKGFAKIDGTIDDQIAIEIESRVFKQIRGAILDLLLHDYPKKLLILLPVHMSNPSETAEKCITIMARFLNRADFQVILLSGTGERPKENEDLKLIQAGLDKLDSSNRT